MCNQQLKGCPFCGKTELIIAKKLGSLTPNFFQVECGNSCATGPAAYSEEAAVDMWNTRAAPDHPICWICQKRPSTGVVRVAKNGDMVGTSPICDTCFHELDQAVK